MRQEPDFEAVSIDGQAEEIQEGEEPEQQEVTEEIPETQQTAENVQEETPVIQQENGQADTPKMQETAERVDGEILNADGSVAKPAPGSLFPEALRQVEAMDEDLRDALEIYLTKCSAVTPYQPFLQMVSESSLTKEDKLYFLNRTINHMEDKEQTKAYHNNAYGLVEFVQSRLSLIHI